MSQLILYSSLGCHLCEQAKTLVEPFMAGTSWQLQEVEIADSEQLVEQYGTSIPVLYRPADGQELKWPFTAKDLSLWLEAIS